MSDQISTAWVNQYRANITQLCQQKDSRLSPFVRTESQTGEYAYFDRIGATSVQRVTGRNQDSPTMNTPHDRRRVGLIDYNWGDFVDWTDLEKVLTDPSSAYVTNAVAAFNRQKDQSIIDAAFGTTYQGQAGATSETWAVGGANQIVEEDYVESGAAVDSGLTIAKLRQAKSILGKNEADDAPLYFAYTQAQLDDLLATTEVTSADYNSVRALVSGSVDSFMGFRFIKTELLTLASSIRSCIAWAGGPNNALLLSTGTNMTVEISRRADKQYNTYIFIKMGIGSTRMEEERIVEVQCAE